MPTPTTVVLFGATGDLAQRKLLPGMLHLFKSGLLTEVQVVGTSLEKHDRDSFTELARKAIAEHGGEGPTRGLTGVLQAAALGPRSRRC